MALGSTVNSEDERVALTFRVVQWVDEAALYEQPVASRVGDYLLSSKFDLIEPGV